MPNCAEDYGVGVDDEILVARPALVVIVVDSDTDHRAGAALMGIAKEGATSVVRGCNRRMSDDGMSGVGGNDARGRNERANDGYGTDGDERSVRGRTSFSESCESDTSSSAGDEGDKSEGGSVIEYEGEEA